MYLDFKLNKTFINKINELLNKLKIKFSGLKIHYNPNIKI